MRRHLESTQFDQPATIAGTIGGIQLVDAKFSPVSVTGDINQEMPEDAIDQPRQVAAEGSEAVADAFGDLLKSDFQFIQVVIAGFIDTWGLTGRTDEQPRKQIRQRRMIVPASQQTPQQIGPAQNRAICRGGATQDDVVAASRARMTAILHELFGAQSSKVRFLVQSLRGLRKLVPVVSRLDVDFHDSRIRGDLEVNETVIARWSISFEDDRQLQFSRSGFDGGYQFQIVFHLLNGRQEDVQHATARLNAQRSPHQSGRGSGVESVHPV